VFSSDATGADATYFPYPTLPATPAPQDAGSAFLDGATDDEWQALLDAMDTVRFAPGDVISAAGDADRALYLLVDGRVRSGDEVTGAPASFGAVTLLTGRPRTRPVTAETYGEALRLGHDALETLAARDPHLGHAVLAELARLVAERLYEHAGPQAEWVV
jgi:CRP-like cAMP-binding protein